MLLEISHKWGKYYLNEEYINKRLKEKLNRFIFN